jgi:hypothetical protein
MQCGQTYGKKCIVSYWHSTERGKIFFSDGEEREMVVPNSKSWNIPEVVIIRRGAGGVLGTWGGWVSWVKGGANGVSLKAT